VIAGVWGEWGQVLRPTVFGLVAAGLTIRLLVRARRLRGVPRVRAWRYSVAEVGMVAGTVPWVWMILTPKQAESGLSLVPLRDLATQLAAPVSGTVVQVGGNLLVLAALGFFLPLRFRIAPDAGRRTAAVLARVALIAAAISTTVEALQYTLDLGRVSSVDDVLLNSLGAVLAALCSRRWWL
jgi:glycopeptide antibiotics resistance protein